MSSGPSIGRRPQTTADKQLRLVWLASVTRRFEAMGMSFPKPLGLSAAVVRNWSSLFLHRRTYSSSVLRFWSTASSSSERAPFGEKELLAQVQCLSLHCSGTKPVIYRSQELISVPLTFSRVPRLINRSRVELIERYFRVLIELRDRIRDQPVPREGRVGRTQAGRQCTP
jgi:hypothetical protein